MVTDFTYSTSTLLGVVETKPRRYERPINGHNVIYHITHNDDNGTTTIVAKIHDDCEDDVLSNFEDRTPFMYLYGNKTFLRCKMNRHPIGRAVCDPRDEYDEEYGKDLAYRRLEVAYWSQYEDRLGKLNEVLMKYFDENSDLMTKISEKHLQRED